MLSAHNEDAENEEQEKRPRGLQRKTPLERGTKGLSRSTKPMNPGKAMSRGNGMQRRTPLRSEPPKRDSNLGSPPRPNGLQRTTPLSPGSKPLASRAPLSQGKGLERRTPLTSTPPPLGQQPAEPRKRIAQQSKKRAAEMPLRRKVVKTILAIQPTCVVPGCIADSQDGHERKTRARGGSITSVFNVVGTCRHHNGVLTEEPSWGYETGLLMHSWDDEPTEPAACLSDMQKAAVRRVAADDWWPTTSFDVEQWWASRRDAV